MSPSSPALSLLLVDDEPLARSRLRTLLADIAPELPTRVAGEADNGLAALACLAEEPVDAVLCDIRMPGMDGIELACHLGRLAGPPAIIFTTAYDSYAVHAFELNAIDYLLKPVRAPRLLAALQKIRPARLPAAALLAPPLAPPLDESLSSLGRQLRGGGRTHLACHERGRLLLVSLADVLYLRAGQKYVSARTREREYLLEDSLSQLEAEFPSRFIRVHRAVLVARDALAGFERAAGGDDAEAYGWALVRGVPERLPVSRRQWGIARSLARSRSRSG